jgi:3-dehydroquinate synthase
VIRIPVRPRRPPEPVYEIRIGRGLGPRISVDLRRRRLASRYVIVTDSHLQKPGEGLLAAFRRRGLQADLVSFPAGESSKTRRVRDEIEDGIIALGAGRDTALVALGGGVVGDLTGFVAATFTRGIPYVQVPTTLIGMVDAAIGGKTGINHRAGKNLIGAFHQPAAVYIDVDFLRTLPERHFNSGMAEVIKCGVIADRGLFEFLEGNAARVRRREPEMMAKIIDACCRIKARVVGVDPRESSRRKILNFGHTIGHALEILTDFRLAHGEAVAVGMAAEARLAARLGLLAPAVAGRIAALPRLFALPVGLPPALEPRAIVQVARHDKKTRGGRIACALPLRLGAMASRGGDYGIPVDDALVLEVLNEMRAPRSRPRGLMAPAGA